MTQHYISWWNLENLFDIENSTDRPERLAKSIKNELKKWKKLDERGNYQEYCQAVVYILERKLDKYNKS